MDWGFGRGRRPGCCAGGDVCAGSRAANRTKPTTEESSFIAIEERPRAGAAAPTRIRRVRCGAGTPAAARPQSIEGSQARWSDSTPNPRCTATSEAKESAARSPAPAAIPRSTSAQRPSKTSANRYTLSASKRRTSLTRTSGLQGLMRTWLAPAPITRSG